LGASLEQWFKANGAEAKIVINGEDQACSCLTVLEWQWVGSMEQIPQEDAKTVNIAGGVHLF
jgi:hypothetical protein